MMKKLKLDHSVARLVQDGSLASTWRMYDDKDLAVDDQVLLIDKVDPHDPSSWRTIGTANIDAISERRIGDIAENEVRAEGFASPEAMLKTYRSYYGPNVGLLTPVKIIHFHLESKPTTKKLDVMPKADKAMIYADGGSRGNPGPSAAGYLIYDQDHRMLVNRGTYLGVTTNNQAEYMALKLALEEAKTLGARTVHVYMDSLLVVNQMRGVFKVKNRDLWPIHDAIQQLCAGFSHVDFTQIPREANKLADAAVNAALDDHLAVIHEQRQT